MVSFREFALEHWRWRTHKVKPERKHLHPAFPRKTTNSQAMPLYEYHCPDCDRNFEKIVSFSAPNPDCPHCASANANKLLSAPAFRLKGSGWYETDFKSDKEQRRNLVEDKSKDAKPEAKPEGKSSEAPSPESGSASKAEPAKAKTETSASKGSSKAES